MAQHFPVAQRQIVRSEATAPRTGDQAAKSGATKGVKMYNGNGNGYSTKTPGSGVGIPRVYMYLGVALLVLLGIWLVSGIFSAGVEGYFALVAGALLVLGNLRDLIANPYPTRSNVALLNTMLGGGLIFFWLGKGFGWIWYVPAVLLVLMAAPLMLGRASVYGAYVNTVRTVVGGVWHTVSGRVRMN